MRVFDGTSLVGGATLALLTGCSGSNIAGPTIGGEIPPAAIGTQTSSGTLASRRLLLTGTPTHGSGFIDLAAIAKNRGPTIAVSAGNVVDIFTPAFMQQVGLLTGFDNPRGVASDNKGDLYVADQENSRVQFYAAGFASPPTTLSDPGEYPLGVDVSANGKYVAVTNELATPLGPGSVSIFKGSTLQRTITYSNLEYALYCAFDGKGNLYVDGKDLNGNVILGEIPHATSGGSTFEQLTTTNTIGVAAGIQVTKAGGQIAIEDPSNHAIYTYNPPSGGSLGAPTEITSLGGSAAPVAFAFTNNMTHLYTADEASSSLLKYDYPAGDSTPVLGVLLGGAPFGTAVVPAQT